MMTTSSASVSAEAAILVAAAVVAAAEGDDDDELEEETEEIDVWCRCWSDANAGAEGNEDKNDGCGGSARASLPLNSRGCWARSAAVDAKSGQTRSLDRE
jgi:hypothetical protein